MSSQPVIVLGMHRSGTSLATALLESAGLNVGTRLMEGNWSNPRGHFEDMDFVEFQRTALVQLGQHQDGWHIAELPELPEEIVGRGRALIADKQRYGRPWGWKDPRTVLFLPLWSRLVPEATYAIVYRAPWEVVESLYRRGDPILTDRPELAVDLWHAYNHVLMQLATAIPNRVVVVNIETMVADPASWVAAIVDTSGLRLRDPETTIYEPSLLHGEEARDRAALIVRHYPEVIDLYDALEALAVRSPATTSRGVSRDIVTAEMHRRRALRDWHDVSGAMAERDRTKRDLLLAQDAIERGERGLNDASRAVAKALSRINGPIGRDLWPS